MGRRDEPEVRATGLAAGRLPLKATGPAQERAFFPAVALALPKPVVWVHLAGQPAA